MQAVSDRAALKALDTTVITAAYLCEDMREGTFVWRLGDYSAEVTIDVAEGFYLAADSVASSVGAWVRIFNGPAYPEWFGARDGSGLDGIAFQRCMAACRGRGIATKVSAATYSCGAGADLRVYPDTPIEAEPGAVLNGSGVADGFIFEPGNYNGAHFSLPSLGMFSGDNVTLRGANLLDLEIGSINGGTNGVVLKLGAPDANTILDNKITVQAISALSGSAVLLSADANGNVCQGNEVYANFSTSCKETVAYDAPAGIAPQWDSNKFVFQAIDPTPVLAGARGLVNRTAIAVSRTIFRCETWFGGLASDATYVSGEFNSLDFYGSFPAAFASYAQWALTGVGNAIRGSFAGFSAAFGRLLLSPNSNSRASWNGGAPINYPKVNCRVVLALNVPQGGIYNAYFYHPFANTELLKMNPLSMNGFVVNLLVATNIANEILVQIVNQSGATKPIGSAIDFDVIVGQP